jgi:hypothetical protein
MSFKLGHVSIPIRRTLLPLFLFCAYDSSVLQNFKIFTHLLPNFSYKDPRVTEVTYDCINFSDRINCALYRHYRWTRAWTLLVIKTRQLLSERESQSAMIICRVWARRFFQFPVMFTNIKKWRSTSWLTMFNSLFSFPTFLLFSPFWLVRSNTWVQWKHLTPERSIDLCLQTFPKLLLSAKSHHAQLIPRMHC